MRHKTIREAVVAATLVTFTLAAAPATARPTGPAAHRPTAAPAVAGPLENWVLSWAGALLRALDRAPGLGDPAKAASPSPAAGPARTVSGSGMELDLGAGIDPLGQH